MLCERTRQYPQNLLNHSANASTGYQYLYIFNHNKDAIQKTINMYPRAAFMYIYTDRAKCLSWVVTDNSRITTELSIVDDSSHQGITWLQAC